MNIVILFRKKKFLSLIILFSFLVDLAQSKATGGRARGRSRFRPYPYVHNPHPGFVDEPKNSTHDDSLNVLSCVCDIRNAAFQDLNINQLPALCTAAASSQNSEQDWQKMTSIKTTPIPFVLYFKEYTYEQWDQHWSDYKKFISYMNDHGVNAIVFDNLYRNSQFDAAKNEDIKKFLQKLIDEKPDGLFGLALPRHAQILPTAFDYSLLDPVVDFYVIQTIDYRRCEYESVIKMKRTSTTGDMRKSLNALRQSKDLGNVLLTVQVYSIGITAHAKHGPALISYSDMCGYKGKRLSSHRKYCKDSLKTLFKKGNLVAEFDMLGVYIQFIDFDDFAGSCGCKNDINGDTKFPATTAIVFGMEKNITKIAFCGNFADGHNQWRIYGEGPGGLDPSQTPIYYFIISSDTHD